MKKKGVISVIVPIYGVESYLEECIESILSQTYPALEVILVDDGSPDRCGEICDRYARRDSRIIVIHQKNGGAAAARNAALRIASGEYTGFVDGDDYLEPDAYEKLLEAMLAHQADIVHGKIRLVYVDGTQIPMDSKELLSFSAPEYLLRFRDDWTCSLSTVKLFRSSVLTDVYYEEGHCIDDEFFTYKGVMNAGRILCIPTVVYNYRQRASSVMQSPDTSDRKCQDIIAYLEKRTQDVSRRFPELKTQCSNQYAEQLLYLAGTELATKKAIRGIKARLLRHMAGGKALFWRQGQRKLSLRILAFLLMPSKPGKAGRYGGTHGEYQFFD